MLFKLKTLIVALTMSATTANALWTSGHVNPDDVREGGFIIAFGKGFNIIISCLANEPATIYFTTDEAAQVVSDEMIQFMVGIAPTKSSFYGIARPTEADENGRYKYSIFPMEDVGLSVEEFLKELAGGEVAALFAFSEETIVPGESELMGHISLEGSAQALYDVGCTEP